MAGQYSFSDLTPVWCIDPALADGSFQIPSQTLAMDCLPQQFAEFQARYAMEQPSTGMMSESSALPLPAFQENPILIQPSILPSVRDIPAMTLTMGTPPVTETSEESIQRRKKADLESRRQALLQVKFENDDLLESSCVRVIISVLFSCVFFTSLPLAKRPLSERPLSLQTSP